MIRGKESLAVRELRLEIKRLKSDVQFLMQSTPVLSRNLDKRLQKVEHEQWMQKSRQAAKES